MRVRQPCPVDGTVVFHSFEAARFAASLLAFSPCQREFAAPHQCDWAAARPLAEPLGAACNIKRGLAWPPRIGCAAGLPFLTRRTCSVGERPAEGEAGARSFGFPLGLSAAAVRFPTGLTPRRLDVALGCVFGNAQNTSMLR
jgi:hypothetical protein